MPEREHPAATSASSPQGETRRPLVEGELRCSPERVIAYESDLLERVSAGHPLDEVLDRLASGFEALWPDTVTSVQVVEADGQHMHVVAGRNLPDSHRAPGVRFPIGPQNGSCGTAAHRREVVIVADIESDPLWAPWTFLALPFGLRACWSVPILNAEGAVVATFAVYHRAPRTPEPEELAVVHRVARIVRIAFDTERREKALRASEERFRRVFADAATGLVVLDSDGHIVEANAAYAAMVGSSETALRGSAPRFHIDGGLDLPIALASLAAGQRESFVVDDCLEHSDGSPVWVKFSGSVAHDTAGQAFGVIGVVEDISAERRAQAELARSESLVRFAGAVAKVGGWALSLIDNTLTWTPVCYDIFEVPHGSPPSFARASSLTHHNWLSALTDASLRCQQDGTPFSLELEAETVNGRPLWLHVVGEAVRNGDKDIVGLRGAVVDVTERRTTLEALREREAMFQIAAQVGRMGGWHVQVPGLEHRWSREALVILGAGSETALTRKEVHQRFAETDRPLLKEAFHLCETEGRTFDHEVRVVRLDGRVIWVRIIGEAVRDSNGTITTVHGAIQDIDEMVRLRQRTRELADRLVATLESLSDPFLTLDRDWRITYLNAAAERILRQPRGVIVGQRINDVFARFDGSPVEKAMTEAMTRGFTGQVEAFSQTLERWVNVTAYPTPEGMAAYIKDVTELHRSREALSESQERFALLSSATNDAIWDWRLEQNSLWWNEGFRTLFGHDPLAIDPTLRSWTDYIHPDDRDRVLASLESALGAEVRLWRGEYRFCHADGHYLHVMDRGHIIRNNEGRAVRMVGGMSDLTERKRAEDQLREQAMLLDKAQDAIIVLTLDHRVRYWNKSAANLYGWTAEEAGNASFELLVHEDPTVFRAATVIVVERGEWVGEVEQVTRGGRRVIVEGRWTLLTNEQGAPSGILALHTDVTEKRRLEQQFLRAQRLESIGTLAGGIAHDLNNMLTPIIMTTSILRGDPSNAALEDDLASVQGCAERGAQMVRQLLVFARGSDGKRIQISLRSVAADVYKFMRETLPKNIGVQLEAPSDIWDIDADATQIHQLITNLCVNARDAMPSGGLLTIALENTTLDELYTGMNLEAKPGPYVLMRVEDTGQGMTPEVVDRIFEPFFTTKAFGQGTGLGLSTVHAIVRGHKGFIHVYSELGRGSRFKVYLPATRLVSEDSQVRAEQVQLPRGKGELILVIDDEEIIRHVTTRMLERYGYRVVTASNGAEAVASYAQLKDQVALVLTDMSMPVMDGPATIIALRAIDPDVKIIGSSGLNANGHIAKAVAAGVDVFVPKPYTAESMLRTIRRVLG